MKSFSKDSLKSRIAIFIDGFHLYQISNYHAHHDKENQGNRVQFQGLNTEAEKIVSSELGTTAMTTSCYYYRGRQNAKRAAEAEGMMYSERVIEEALSNLRYHIRHYHINKSDQIPSDLILDAYTAALRDEYDYAVLIVSRVAYVPIIDALNKLGKGVVLLSWNFEYEKNGEQSMTRTSFDLFQKANVAVDMINYIRENSDNKIFTRDDEVIPESVVEEGESEYYRGIVLSKKSESSYGFIREYETRGTIFFHSSDLLDVSFESIKEGDEVWYNIGYNVEGKPKATKIELIGQDDD